MLLNTPIGIIFSGGNDNEESSTEFSMEEKLRYGPTYADPGEETDVFCLDDLDIEKAAEIKVEDKEPSDEPSGEADTTRDSEWGSPSRDPWIYPTETSTPIREATRADEEAEDTEQDEWNPMLIPILTKILILTKKNPHPRTGGK